CRSVSSGRCLPDLRPAPFGTGVSRPVVLVSHLLALGLYGVATALALAPFAGLRPAPLALTLGAPLAGAAVHVVGVAQLTPVGVAPVLSILALFLVLLRVVSERLFRASAVALFTGPLATGLVARALLFGLDAAQIVWGMLTWLVLGWAVGVRVVRHWAGRRAAFASIAGFVAVVLVYLALKLAAPGTERFL